MESLGNATAAFTHVVLNPVGKVYFARGKSSSSRRAKRICFGARIWHHRATRCCSLVFPRRADSVRERLSGQRFPTAHAAVEREVFAFAANGKDFDDSANDGGRGGDDRGGDDRGGRNDRRPDGDGSEESHAFLTHLAALVYCALARASGASANYMHASLFGTALLATQLEESRRIRYYGSGSMIDPAAFVGDSQRPVVILLSWLGAQHRHMSKYAEWYRARGYDVVTLFNGLQTALIPTFSRRQALRLLHLIDEIPENRPIVVHSFSIGTGIYGYYARFHS
ncbi:hypothetical protein F1559_003834 [Cyanidiococcus yangmingshanensis]|uniref:Transmembrane protein 53 n=1 Tax=Cyanidiococcus yangmingshanensis TaxID=2690220 RepID=A0A7J7IK05_9RHOD|nr:hypothetical protein F1559_003834 [Cyanidiococcus yangmingshanensis]